MKNLPWIMGIWSWIVLPRCPMMCKSAPIYSQEKLHTCGISDSFHILMSQHQHVHVKKGIPFPIFLGHNKHEKQMKKVLQYLVTPSQYMLLRELAINELARNLCITDKKTKLRKKFKNKLLSLANGKYKKQQLHLLYPILQLLAFNIVLSLAS